MNRKRVLVAPLDWGLGHATRCIPVIRILQELQCEVFLAGAGPSLKLLKLTFPSFKAFELPGYNPVYPSSGSMMFKLLLQGGKFMRTVMEEHRQVEQLVKENKIELIISDNRYGCYSPEVTSVFITHQVNLLAPSRWKWLGLLANAVTARFIKKFTVTWVPDFPGSVLSGKLSATFDRQTCFIGPLSRLEKVETTERKYNILALLSGPEPQRSNFEELVTRQLVASGLRGLIVRGVVDSNKIQVSKNVEVADHLTAEELSYEMAQAEIVLSRSGYSTVMDLARLAKKAIFVPTPGQTEQEYLAKKFKQEGIAFSMEQKDFLLSDALKQSENFKGFTEYPFDDSLLKKHLTDLLSTNDQRPVTID
ncbi:MAG: hypothetical protein KF725_09270 [Cyclobacteriaceae bacterium]|nr:hypothetical protein [Cyclobacteriaceae bacterium]UYN88132.1 MAG: hypothetical protein KIT51_07770 [Cyclobacteriaceae bacterium]